MAVAAPEPRRPRTVFSGGERAASGCGGADTTTTTTITTTTTTTTTDYRPQRTLRFNRTTTSLFIPLFHSFVLLNFFFAVNNVQAIRLDVGVREGRGIRGAGCTGGNPDRINETGGNGTLPRSELSFRNVEIFQMIKSWKKKEGVM
ncbi:hypothetical protein M0802_006887 [Mischocyttarus mexicanus]|nr:hypothetical protein M0802_006887 [Mischocyttarus mexicanus]